LSSETLTSDTRLVSNENISDENTDNQGMSTLNDEANLNLKAASSIFENCNTFSMRDRIMKKSNYLAESISDQEDKLEYDGSSCGQDKSANENKNIEINKKIEIFAIKTPEVNDSRGKKGSRKKSAKSYGYGITRGIENPAITNKRRKYEIKSKSKLKKKHKEDTKHIKSIANECNELQTSRGRKVFRYNGSDFIVKRGPSSTGNMIWRCRNYNRFRCPSLLTTVDSRIRKQPSNHSIDCKF